MAAFQGKPVHATKIALTGGAKEVFSDRPQIDQIVSLEISGRVTGVDYRVNDSTGELEEFVRVKVLDVDSVNVETFPKAVTTPSGVTPMVDRETGEMTG